MWYGVHTPSDAVAHPAARRLLARLGTGIRAPIQLAVTAPGGYGKGTLLYASRADLLVRLRHVVGGLPASTAG
jgi:hypothetical protein